MLLKELLLHGKMKSRLVSVSLRWSQTRGFMERVLTRMRMDVAGCAFMTSIFIALFLLQVESVLWRSPAAPQSNWMRSPLSDVGLFLSPFEGLTAEQTKDFPWVVLVVALANAWLLDQGTRRFGGRDFQFRKGVLWLKPLLAAPPFLGLWILPIWRALMESLPAWAVRPSVPTLRLDHPRIGVSGTPTGAWRLLGDALNQLGSSKWFFAVWMVPVNLFALRAGLAWLHAPGQDLSGIPLNLGRWGLRALGFLCVGFYLVKRARGQQITRRRKVILGMALLSWLSPQVSPFIATLFIYLQAEQQWIQTAVRDAFGLAGSRSASSPGPASLDDPEIPVLARWLLGSGEREASREILGKKLGFYRWKTFLLTFDTGGLLYVFLRIGKRFPRLDWPVGIVLVLLIGLATVLLAVGLAARSRAFAVRYFKPDSWQREQDRHPAMRYALLAGLAFCGGFLLGHPAAERDIASLTRGLTFCMAVCVSQVLFLLPGTFQKLSGKSEEKGTGALLWFLVFQTLGGMGEEMGKKPELAQGVTALFHGIVVLTPLWALLLWCFRISWLLRPFRLRDAFNPEISRRSRWQIRMIAITSLLPMGGLAIPFWIRALRKLEEAEAGRVPTDAPLATATPAPDWIKIA